MTTHRAVAERDGHGWSVRVEGLAGPDRVYARDLADVEPRARRLISAYGNETTDIGIDVAVTLPPAIQDRLDVIRQLCADIAAEYDTAIIELVEAGLSLSDVSRVLRLHHRPPRPLTITNAEVAEHGLDRHPDAVGLDWDDHGHCRMVKCRMHVEATRKEYGDLPPDGENALVYRGAEFDCDFCDEGGD